MDFDFPFLIHYSFIHSYIVHKLSITIIYRYLNTISGGGVAHVGLLGLHQHPVEQMESHGVGVVLLHHLAKRVQLCCQRIDVFCILF